MKINKLFHWLYAFIMFIPVFAIFISCGYVMFNKNAYESYSGKNSNQFEIIDVNDYQSLKPGYRYRFISSNTETINNMSKQLVIDNVEIISTNATNQSIIDNISNADAISTTWYSNIAFLVPIIDNTSQPALDLNSFSIIFDFDLIGYSQLNNYTFTQLYDSFIKRIEYNNNYNLDNVFYYSIDQLKQNSLFNWSKNSFLAEPITYITDLFGIDNDNLIIYLMSYWLDISLIWLVFDLVMYVPLLVHRWLDKGVID